MILNQTNCPYLYAFIKSTGFYWMMVRDKTIDKVFINIIVLHDFAEKRRGLILFYDDNLKDIEDGLAQNQALPEPFKIDWRDQEDAHNLIGQIFGYRPFSTNQIKSSGAPHRTSSFYY